MEIKEYEKENLNKNKEENENTKIEKEDKLEKLKKFLSSYIELIIFVLSVVIPAIMGALYKIQRASYYGYPVEFFDVDFTYIISRTIIIAYFIIIILGTRIFKISEKYPEFVLGSNLGISFLTAIEILRIISFLLVCFDKEYIADYFSFSNWYAAAYLISFITISRKEDFEIFKEMYEESKKACEEDKDKNKKVPNSKKIYVWFAETILCLTSFFREKEKIKKLFGICHVICIIIFTIFFIVFLFMGGPEHQKEYLIFKDEKGNEKAVVSIKGTDYKYSDCKIEKIGTYKDGNPKYKLIIYTNVKESISQNGTKPKTIYFHEVEINKNEDKPKQQINCIAVKQ